MRQIVSTSILSFLEAIRSRMVLAIAALLALIVFGLPSVMNNAADSLALTHNTIFYTLSLSSVSLFVSAVWTSSAAISSEIKSRTLQLIRVKPIPLWKFWLGKWLGLSAIFSLLLALAFLTVYLQLSPPPSFYTANAKIAPDLPSISAQLDSVIQNAIQKGITNHLELKELRTRARSQLPFASLSLPPNSEWHCLFSPDSPILSNSPPLALRLTLQLNSLSLAKSSLLCSFRAIDNSFPSNSPSAQFTLPITNLSSREMILPIPSAPFVNASQINFTLTNTGRPGAATILLQPRQGLFLLRPACSLAENFFRAFLISSSVIFLLVAIGLTLGAFFSLPVAVFCATGLIIAVFAANYTISDPAILDVDPSEVASLPLLKRFNTHCAIATTRSLYFLSQSAIKPSPLSSLAASEQLPSRDIFLALLSNTIAIPLLLMLFSSFEMNRKELAE